MEPSKPGWNHPESPFKYFLNRALTGQSNGKCLILKYQGRRHPVAEIFPKELGGQSVWYAQLANSEECIRLTPLLLRKMIIRDPKPQEYTAAE